MSKNAGCIAYIFASTWLSGVAVQRIYQNNKNDDFCEELLSENDFEVVLATPCCYDYGTNDSEAVQKIARDQKDVVRVL